MGSRLLDLEYKWDDPEAKGESDMVAVSEEEIHGKSNSTGISKVDDMRFLGILLWKYFLFIVNKLMDDKIEVEPRVGSKLYNLRSLHEILKLMITFNHTIDKFAPKIMTILQNALEDVELASTACDIWELFIKKISTNTLKNNLYSIFVSLTSCITDSSISCGNPSISVDQVPRVSDVSDARNGAHIKACKLLKTLVVDQRENMKDQVKKLPCLFDRTAELQTVFDVLMEEKIKISVREQLVQLSDLLSHDSKKVRLAALMELKRVLRMNPRDLHGLILDGQTQSPSVQSVIESLLAICRSDHDRNQESRQIRLACADCLGLLGAIDPNRLIRAAVTYEPEDELDLSSLTRKLLSSYLYVELRAAQRREVQDSMGYAIQCLLPFLYAIDADFFFRAGDYRRRGDLVSISEEGSCEVRYDDDKDAICTVKMSLLKRQSDFMTTEGGVKKYHVSSEPLKEGEKVSVLSLPSHFPSIMESSFEIRGHDDPLHVLEVIKPYWETNYEVVEHVPLPPPPVYRHGMTYERWISDFTRNLIMRSSGVERELFFSLKSVVKHSSRIALFLLPYLVQNVLRKGVESERKFITDEIKELTDNIKQDALDGSRQLCAQAIFSLIDHLKKWSSWDGKRRRGASSSFRNYSPKFDSKSFFEGIHMTKLADASFKCRAYARALMYLEMSLKSKSGADRDKTKLSGPPVIDRDDVNFLQRIYRYIDEPDGLSGILALRNEVVGIDTGKDTLNQIIDHEHAGRWTDALMCYEAALQTKTSPILSGAVGGSRDTREVQQEMHREMHKGLMKCLLQLGHLETSIHHVEGMMQLHGTSELTRDLMPYALEASWRMSRWERLEVFLGFAENFKYGSKGGGGEVDAQYSYHVSRAMLCLYRNEPSGFNAALCDARLSVMTPLSAASMESYQRAYPLLAKLHNLNELETGFQVLQISDSGDKRGLINQLGWKERLKLTEPNLGYREPTLAIRRVIYRLNKMHEEEAHTWLMYAKNARLAGHFQNANTALLHASVLNPVEARRAKAKLLYHQGLLPTLLLFVCSSPFVMYYHHHRSYSCRHPNNGAHRD
jgi:serine/threonine-protein kinase ATR